MQTCTCSISISITDDYSCRRCLPELVGSFIHGWGSSGMEHQVRWTRNQSRRPYENWLSSSSVQGLVQQGQRGWFVTQVHRGKYANTAHWRPPPDTAHPCWIWSFKQHFSFGFKNVDKDTTCTKVQEQRIKESLTFDLSKVKGSLIQSKKKTNNINYDTRYCNCTLFNHSQKVWKEI